MTLALLVLLATADTETLIRLHDLAARVEYVRHTRGKVKLGETPAQTARLLGVDEAQLAGTTITMEGDAVRIASGDVAIVNGQAPASSDPALAAAQARLARYTDKKHAYADAARKTIENMQLLSQEIQQKRGTSGGDDEWGTPFHIEVDVDGSRYRIVSAGADRVFDPTSWAQPMNLDPASDMVLENGTFRRKLDADRYEQSAQ